MVKMMTNHLHCFFILTACLLRTIEVGSKSFKPRGRPGRPSAARKHKPPKPAKSPWRLPESIKWMPPDEYQQQTIKGIDLTLIEPCEVRRARAHTPAHITRMIRAFGAARMAPTPPLPRTHTVVANPHRDALAYKVRK